MGDPSARRNARVAQPGGGAHDQVTSATGARRRTKVSLLRSPPYQPYQTDYLKGVVGPLSSGSRRTCLPTLGTPFLSSTNSM
jgi:hypothetical protein